jgi:hypothetical protein
MKKAAIVNVGRFGFMTRGEYDEQAEQFREFLSQRGISVEVTTVLPTSETIARCDAFIFLTRGVIADARALKASHPDKVVVLLTGAVKNADADGGIIPIWKDNYHEVVGLLMDRVQGDAPRRLEGVPRHSSALALAAH